MASEPAAKRARREGDETGFAAALGVGSVRSRGRARVAEEIAEAKARGASGPELSEIYKRGYEAEKAASEASAVETLAGLAEETKARLQKENVSLEVCEDLITPKNVKIVADILDTLGPLKSGGRRRRSSSRRHGMRGGALKEDIYAFFAALCSLPKEVAGRVSDATGASLRAAAAKLTDEATIDTMTQLALKSPKVALGVLAGYDLRRDESLITKIVTTILQRVGDALTPADVVASIGTFGLNAAKMAGSAGLPLATLITILITRYAAREAWVKAYDAADATIRAEYARGPAVGERASAAADVARPVISDASRLARTYALAVKTFLTNFGAGMKARVDAYLASREAAVAQRLDLELEEYMAVARRTRQQVRMRALLDRALPELEDAAGAGGGEGGRRRTRKHRVVRRKTHKKRFHRK